MVQVIESELEISHVTKPVSLPFEGFDFVVDSFHKAARDAVVVLKWQALSTLTIFVTRHYPH